MKKNIYNFNLIDLENELQNLEESKYRAKQIFNWIYKQKRNSFFEMTDISKASQIKLDNYFNFCLPKIKLVESSKDKTQKFLFSLSDDELIESVVMNHDYGKSICISSQVGCAMGCKFCTSGTLLFKRNLEPSEMIGQILKAEEHLNEKITRVVIMGIGEPLLNYEAVLKFIKTINSDYGMAIGGRHITLSTCGIVPMIEHLSEENLPINLAISLHFPFDEMRKRFMPIAKKYSLEVLMNALRNYFLKTKRRITIEYILIKDINDNIICAKELARLLKGLNAYVNLIPINSNPFLLERPQKDVINTFHKFLLNNSITATIRKEFGHDINAACGQLRGKYK